MKKHIPNILTLANLLCGVLAIPFALEGNLFKVAVFLGLSLIFDFLDGFSARLLKAYSELGKQLDSLSDLVSFGVVPALLLRSVFQHVAPETGVAWLDTVIVNLPLMVAAASSYRLGKFNLDTEQTETFKGVPVPASAMFIWSLVYFVTDVTSGENFGHTEATIILLGGALLISIMMISTVPMFSLKMKSLDWKGNEVRYPFLVFTIIAMVLFKWSSFLFIIWTYVMVGIILKALDKK